MKKKYYIYIISLSLFAIYLLSYINITNGMIIENYTEIIYFLSVLGTILYVFCVYTWYKVRHKIIDLYNIFLTLYFLFNFGQCFMWAFNIHKIGEIGSCANYGVILTNKDIILTQMTTLACMVFFHCGAICCSTKKRITYRKYNIKNEVMYKKNMSLYCKILLAFVTPVTFYILYKKYLISSQYGYNYVFYGEYDIGYISLVGRLFFPCIYGVLFSCDFNKKTVYNCYGLIAIYFVISLLIGSRGSIVYELFIFIYLHNRYVNKISLRNAIVYFFILFGMLSLFSTVETLRDGGLNIDSLIEKFSLENNAIIDSIFEIGGTMAVQGIIIQNGYKIYPYGNTYILGILAIVSEKVVRMINPSYLDLNTWFSSQYLKLNYGAGFSIVGEVLLNFGPYVGPLMMFIIGYVITYLAMNLEQQSCKKAIFSLISFSSFVMFIRGTFGYYIKYWFFVITIFYALFWVFKMFRNNNFRDMQEFYGNK